MAYNGVCLFVCNYLSRVKIHLAKLHIFKSNCWFWNTPFIKNRAAVKKKWPKQAMNRSVCFHVNTSFSKGFTVEIKNEIRLSIIPPPTPCLVKFRLSPNQKRKRPNGLVYPVVNHTFGRSSLFRKEECFGVQIKMQKIYLVQTFFF
jgi:hypothetical protein